MEEHARDWQIRRRGFERISWENSLEIGRGIVNLDSKVES